MLRRAIPLLALAVLGVAAAATARQGARTTGSSANAYAVRAVVPGRDAEGTPAVAAPPAAADSGGGYTLPDAADALTTGAYSADTRAQVSERASSSEAISTLVGVSLFGGEVRVDRVVATAQAAATASSGSGSLGQSSVTGLVLLGQPVDPLPNGRFALADWGYVLTLVQAETGGEPGTKGYHGTVTALDVHLSADHGGLPAGTEILIGYAEAAAQASPPPPATTSVPPAHVGKRKHVATPRAPEPRPGDKPTRRQPPKNIRVKLSPSGYVFPVYGPVSFIDSFGAGRADVGWHHGEDLFAPLGAPILAVADGTVFSVGWNDIGGNRVWLKDRKGNEFYYAHLSAFSTLAVNGAQVAAGTVLGFVGNTGDAQGTPFHLHFEVHPKKLLKMGYDGVIDPYKWLLALQHLQDISIPQHVPGGPGGVGQIAPQGPAPGAVLLQQSDISTADGLDPRSLRRVFRHSPFEGSVSVPAGGAPLNRG